MQRALRDEPGADFDAVRLKLHFPLLRAAGELHYLDNAATSQKPAAVIDAIDACYRGRYGPVHRGLYPLAEEASRYYEHARTEIARFINAPAGSQVIFTRGTTEAINLVALGWLRERLSRGDAVWTTALEHHADFLPWQAACHARGAKLSLIECDTAGTLDLENPAARFDERTRLVALAHVSNVLGTVNPVNDVVERARAAGAAVLVDGAQAAGHGEVDVSALGCDFYAFSAHKMYGPTGIGALYVAPDRVAELEPVMLGGGMVEEVAEQTSTWLPAPACFEAGSPNLAGAVGFSAAAAFVDSQLGHAAEAHAVALARRAAQSLADMRGVTVYGPPPGERASGIVSFDVDGVHPHDVAQVAGERGVAVRAGHHCCQPLMRRLGVAATVRASFVPYNTAEDVDALVAAVSAARRRFL